MNDDVHVTDEALCVLEEDAERRAMSSFGLISEDRVNKAWAALALLSRFKLAVHIDTLYTFLAARQREADRVGFNPDNPASFYALRGSKYRGWTDHALIQTLNLATKERGVIRALRVDGRYYFAALRPSEMGHWTVANTDLPYDPSWRVTMNALDLAKETA